jgi:hypothetical protein
MGLGQMEPTLHKSTNTISEHKFNGIVWEAVVNILQTKQELRLECQESLFPVLGPLFTLLSFRNMCLLLLINKHNVALHMLDFLIQIICLLCCNFAIFNISLSFVCHDLTLPGNGTLYIFFIFQK